MRCNNCNYFLLDDIKYCPNCGTETKDEDTLNVQEIKRTERNKIYSIISLILSLIPVMLYIYCSLYRLIHKDGHLTDWLIVIYFISYGWIIYIISLFLGIKSSIYKENIFSLISIVVNITLPFIFFIIQVFFHTISK